MNKNMVTFIDELPSISDIDDGNMYPMIPPSESNKIKRMIRNHDHNIPIESGMNTKSHQIFQDEEMQRKMFEDEQQRQFHEQQMRLQEQQQREQQQEHYNNNDNDNRKKKKKHHHHFDDDLSCISVAEHTTNCMVCSKLYNDDRSIYSGVIIVLLIISLILLKKVVEK